MAGSVVCRGVDFVAVFIGTSFAVGVVMIALVVVVVVVLLLL